MALQRMTASSTNSFSREAAEPFAIRTLREDFAAHPPKEQERIRADVIARLRQEAHRRQNQPSALARLARQVYGITVEDL